MNTPPNESAISLPTHLPVIRLIKNKLERIGPSKNVGEILTTMMALIASFKDVKVMTVSGENVPELRVLVSSSISIAHLSEEEMRELSTIIDSLRSDFWNIEMQTVPSAKVIITATGFNVDAK